MSDYLAEVAARAQRIADQTAAGPPAAGQDPENILRLRSRIATLRAELRDAHTILAALTTAAERAVEPGWWTSPVRRAALADAAREARTTLNGDAQ